MTALPEPAERRISFRQLLRGEISQLLVNEGLGNTETTDALSDLVVALAHYREEGTQLFPQVFFCKDVSAMLKTIQGHDALALGDGPCGRETVRHALKRTAPLARNGWHIYVELSATCFRYGVFRSIGYAVCESPIDILRSQTNVDVPALCVLQLADNVIEIRGSGGTLRYIYLSDARHDEPLPTSPFDELVEAATDDVRGDIRDSVRTYVRRSLSDALRSSHGALIAVVSIEKATDILLDAVKLDPPIAIQDQVARYLAEKDEDAIARLHSTSHLLAGMVSSDGITILRSDASILGYNAFIRSTSEPGHAIEMTGGARRRAYRALCDHVGRDMTAAYCRSQDGWAECKRSL